MYSIEYFTGKLLGVIFFAGIAFCAFSQNNIKKDDFFNEFSNHYFIKYVGNDSNYTRFIAKVKKDFMVGGMDLSQDSGQVLFEQYIELRNVILRKKSIENYVIALELTKLITILYWDYLRLPQRFESQDEYKAFVDKFIDKIKVSKNEFFNALDEGESQRNSKWVKLSVLGNGNIIEGKNNAWYKYLKNAKLYYYHNKTQNSNMLTRYNEKLLDYPVLTVCLLSILKESKITTLIIETSLVVDLIRMVNITFDYKKSNDYNNSYNKIELFIHEYFCKRPKLWLFANQVECDHPDKMGHYHFDRYSFSLVFTCPQ